MRKSESVSSYRLTINNYQLLIAIYICLILVLLLSPAQVFAHKVIVFAWVDGNIIHTESKFNGGRKVKAGRINVFDPGGKELLNGITDENGEFSFEIPQKTDLKIELLAGTGHRGEWTIQADEIEPDEIEKPENLKPENLKPGNSKQAAEPKPAVSSGNKPIQDTKPDISSSEIQVMLEKSLDKKLKPIIKMLADSQEKKPSINEIIGGIGYIIGLMGIAMYFKAKQVQEK